MMNPDSQPKSRSTLGVMLVMGGAVAVLAVVSGVVWLGISTSRFATRVAELERQGQPVSVADLLEANSAAAISPRDNAATYLARCQDSLAQLAVRLSKLDETDPKWRERMTSSHVAEIAAGFAAHPDVLTNLTAAAACSEYRPATAAGVLPDAYMKLLLKQSAVMRSAGRVLSFRAAQLTAEDKTSEAFACLLEMLQLARLQERQPLLNNYLVGVALHTAAADVGHRLLAARNTRLTAAQHEQLDEWLSKADSAQAYVAALSTDRAYAIDQLNDSGMGIVLMRQRLGGAMLTAIEREMASALAADGGAAVVSTEARPEATATDRLLEMQQRSFEASHQAMNRLRSALRRLRIANALKRAGEDPTQWTAAQLELLELPEWAKRDAETGAILVLPTATDQD